MSENNTTSSATVMRLNVSSNSNGIVFNAASINSILKTVNLPNSNPVSSNSTSKLSSNLTWNFNDSLNSKETNNLDTCFQAENLQQLSTNVLPPYIPGSPTSVINLESFEFHCCTDCGDTFALKSSLTFHLERRSILIRFPCAVCKSVKTFYNRCMLLSHIRSHTDKNKASDITRAVVIPLPRIQMDGLQTESSNVPDDELSSSAEDNSIPPSDLLECSLNVLEGDDLSSDKTSNEDSKNAVKVKCLDCNEEFNSTEERAQHLTQDDKIPVIVNQCNKCNMVCPSKCFLKAHQRIHLQISPYVCPECGGSPTPVWIDFQYHVKFHCFHNARGIGYKCPVCKRLCATNDALLKHMELHTEKYAKCNSCPRAYMNVGSFNAHIKLYHADDDTSKLKYNMIYKCSLCDIVFLNQEQMLAHRSTHLKEQICEYVFSCMQCGKPHENKKDLSEHIRTYHPKIYKYLVTSKQNSESKNKNTDTIKPSFLGKIECIYCNSILSCYQGYKTHLAKAHANYNQPCAYCYMVFNSREDMISHGKKHLNKGSYLCLLCNNKRWSDEKHLENHLRKHAETVQHCTVCPVCDEILKTPPEVASHLREEHKLFFKVDSFTKQSKEIVTCHFCHDSFAKDSELQDHLKLKHQIDSVKRHTSTENEDKDSDNVCKKSRIEGNVCTKCNYHSTVREDFKKHILSHKTNKSTSQCQECGQCFVVEPALVKHLRIAHKISDTKKYIEEEGTNCMPDFENPTEVSTCNSLICNVCFTTFSNESSLKTHMRSHGMAFIQAAKSNNT
ncbi:zinc finger protein 532 [Parasteatoda tepidariorum]|uniref:zinc finger protein 532 n=1 Tax=Parasteatoda tepidariorum TaxID=114398 RepID=UPI00077FC16A|nr:zinc finger protein 687b [Parasteatoda tepidariorum]XP_042903550.1 zinc finger protein 687b [Parasteatoda tepidariorum]